MWKESQFHFKRRPAETKYGSSPLLALIFTYEVCLAFCTATRTHSHGTQLLDVAGEVRWAAPKPPLGTNGWVWFSSLLEKLKAQCGSSVELKASSWLCPSPGPLF